MSFTHRELQKCAEREVAMRNNVFRKRDMTPARHREIAMMVAIAEHFRELADADEMAGREADGQMFITFGDGKSVALPLYERKK
jgi:hypothetical protein